MKNKNAVQAELSIMQNALDRAAIALEANPAQADVIFRAEMATIAQTTHGVLAQLPDKITFMRRNKPHFRPGLAGTLYDQDPDAYTDLRVYEVLADVQTRGWVVGHKMHGKDGWETITPTHDVHSGHPTRTKAVAALLSPTPD